MLNLEESLLPVSTEGHGRQPVGFRQALFDRWAGHALVNIFVPSVGVTTLSRLYPPAVKALQAFFGEELPKFMPLINVFGVSTLVTLIETAVRSCCCNLDKRDDEVHVPFESTSRQKAVCFIVVGLILQTTDAVVQEYDSASIVQTVFGDLLHTDGFAAFATQFLLGHALNAALQSYQQEGGVLNLITTEVYGRGRALYDYACNPG